MIEGELVGQKHIETSQEEFYASLSLSLLSRNGMRNVRSTFAILFNVFIFESIGLERPEQIGTNHVATFRQKPYELSSYVPTKTNVKVDKLTLHFRTSNLSVDNGIVAATLQFRLSAAGNLHVKWLEGDMEAPVESIEDVRFLVQSIFSCRIVSFSFPAGELQGSSSESLWESLQYASGHKCEIRVDVQAESRSQASPVDGSKYVAEQTRLSADNNDDHKSVDYIGFGVESSPAPKPDKVWSDMRRMDVPQNGGRSTVSTDVDSGPEKDWNGQRTMDVPDGGPSIVSTEADSSSGGTELGEAGEEHETLEEGHEDNEEAVEPTVVTTMLHHLHSARRESMRFSFNGSDVVAQWVRGGAIFPINCASDLAVWACRLFEGYLTDAAAVCVGHPSDSSAAGLEELRSLEGDVSGAELFSLIEANWTLLIRTMPAPPPEDVAEDQAAGLPGFLVSPSEPYAPRPGSRTPGVSVAADTGEARVWIEEADGGRREEVSMTVEDVTAKSGGGNGSGVLTWRRGGVAVAIESLKDVMVPPAPRGSLPRALAPRRRRDAGFRSSPSCI